MNLLIEIGGWVGSACLLSAYFLVSRRRLDGDSRTFQWLNFVGAALLFVNALDHRAWALASVEGAWMCIAVAALVRSPTGTEAQQNNPLQ